MHVFIWLILVGVAWSQNTSSTQLCPVGYKLVNGGQCVDVDECRESTVNPCQHPPFCHNTDGDYREKESRLLNAVRTPMYIDILGNCLSLHMCGFRSQMDIDLTTTCRNGFTGKHCDVNPPIPNRPWMEDFIGR